MAPGSETDFGHSKQAELGRLTSLIGTAHQERESWDSYKERERAKRKEETDKMMLEEQWREEHRAQLDGDRERLLLRGTNHQDDKKRKKGKKKSKQGKKSRKGKKKKEKKKARRRDAKRRKGEEGAEDSGAAIGADASGGPVRLSAFVQGESSGGGSSSSSNDDDSSSDSEGGSRPRTKKAKRSKTDGVVGETAYGIRPPINFPAPPTGSIAAGGGAAPSAALLAATAAVAASGLDGTQLLLPLAANGAATQAGLLELPETASGHRRRRRWGPPATAVNTADGVNGPAATLLQNQLAQAYSAGLAAGAAGHTAPQSMQQQQQQQQQQYPLANLLFGVGSLG
jgi:hypothetical protein